MTCKEIHEQITAYVDNRVDEQEYRAKVHQHIKYCPDCRAAYELELMTKMVVRERAQRSAAPDSLRASIERGVDSMSDLRKGAISTAAEGEPEPRSERIWELFASPVGVAVAMLLVIIGAYVIIDPSSQSDQLIVDSPATPSGGGGTTIAAENFFNKALQNFEAIRAGQLMPQLSTDDGQELSEYFKENGVGYTVTFMQRMKAPLAGGVVSKHGDARFAHIIYGQDEEIYYIFEVPQESLRKGAAIYVTTDVLERLDRGEKIWEEPGGAERLVMFKQGDLVCAMVSNAPRAAMESVVG